MNRSRFSRRETAFVLLTGLLLFVPESSDLGYPPYALETALGAACSAALALVVLGVQRVLRRTGAILAGVLVATFLDLYFLSGALPVAVATLLAAALMLTPAREAALRFSCVAAVVFTMLVLAGRSDSLLDTNGPGWETDLSDHPNQRPAVIHLVLDEFMGAKGLQAAAGVPQAEVHALEDFFIANGFKVFENAHSTSRLTWVSFGDFLSGVGERNSTGAAGSGEPLRHSRHELGDNPYFRTLAAAGYPIHSVYSEAVQLCPAEGVSACRHYGFRKRGDLASRYSPSTRHATEIYAQALEADLYNGATVRGVALFRWLLRSWHRWTGVAGDVKAPSLAHVLVSLAILDQLAAEIGSAARGQAYFAHLLIPHRPWRLDARCRLRHPTARAHGDLYWQQVQCLQSRLKLFFDAIRANPALADAVIVVQGDHGARLDNRDPPPGLRREHPQMLDAFNAFVAVRSPGLAPGVDSRDLSLADVVKRVESVVRDGPARR